MTNITMVGTYPDGKITKAIFNENAEIIEETDVFYLNDEEIKALKKLKLTKPFYFELNPQPIKIREIPNRLPHISLPEQPSNKFDLMDMQGFFMSMIVKRAIIRKYYPSNEDKKL